MKKLSIYLASRDVKEFAKKLKVTPRSVYYWLSGKATPSVTKAIKVEEITKGFVTVYDWA